MRKIKAEIDPKGKLNLEFIGFIGDECTQERQRLREIMQEYGVTLEPEKITKKTRQQIEMETSKTKHRKMESSHTVR